MFPDGAWNSMQLSVAEVCHDWLAAKLDDAKWTDDMESSWPDGKDGHFVDREPMLPYSDVYMHLLMTTISTWPYVKCILPTKADLSQGPLVAAQRCATLLTATYKAAYDPMHKISVMALLSPELYDDKNWHALQKVDNKYFDLKREVCNIRTE